MLRGVKMSSAAVIACLGVLAVLLFAGAAQARVVKLPSGRVISILPIRGATLPPAVTTSQLRRPATSSCDTSTNSGPLTNNCGPVVHSSKPYLIFWDPSSAIPSGSRNLLEQYLTDTSTSGTMASDVYGVVRQYFDSSGYAGQSQTFSSLSQVFADNQAFPTTGNCTPTQGTWSTCLTDGQVQTEINRVIAANGWPTGGTSANAPIYFVVLPPSVDECTDSTACADNVFCAYHSAYGSSPTLYSVIPLALETAGKACQWDGYSALQEPNSDPADLALGSLSHEFNETVTDPLPPSGWYDGTDGAEVGDLCAAYGPIADPAGGSDPNAYLPVLGGDATAGTLYDQVINSDHYYTQTEWSNGAGDCIAQPDNASLTPSISAPSTSATGNVVNFNASGSTVAAGVSSATWSWGDGTTSFVTGSLTSSHTYSTQGSYPVTLTLVDDHGDVATTSSPVIVTIDPAPIAAFTAPSSAPIGTFVSFDGSSSSDANAGATLSYAWKFGDGTTSVVESPQHKYLTPGNHIVSLKVTDSNGFYSATTTKTISVTTQPLVAGPTASPTKVLTGQAVNFSAAGSSDPNAGGSINSYRWSFGDGATGAGNSVAHAYSKAGIYTARLTVSDAYGLTASRSLGVTVVVFPKITRVATSLKNHVHYLRVSVNQAGKVTAARGSATLAQPGTAAIKLKLTRFQLRRLAAHHAVKLHVTVVFTPAFGPVVKLVKTITLKH